MASEHTQAIEMFRPETLGVIREPNLPKDDAHFVVGVTRETHGPTFFLAHHAGPPDCDPSFDIGSTDFRAILKDDGTILELEGTNKTAREVPKGVLLRFIATALYEVKRHPLDVRARVMPETVSAQQLGAVAAVGFQALHYGDMRYCRSPRGGQDVSILRPAGEDDYETMARLARQREKARGLTKKTHEQWLVDADTYLGYAILQESERGLEDTVHLFERARGQFVGALGTLPTENGKIIKPSAELLIGQAGCLARLAGCMNLRPYEEAVGAHPDTFGRNRNDDYFNLAISLYEQAEELIGPAGSDELWLLIGSGRAQAYAIRAGYVRKKAQKNNDPVTADTVPPQIEAHAITELKKVQAIVTDGVVVEKLNKQIDDTEKGIVSSGDTGELRVADQVLLDLIKS